MLFGKHINRYYLKHLPTLLLGIIALVVVDYFQLIVPELYKMVINGVNNGYVEQGGEQVVFNMDFLLDKICLPLIIGVVVFFAVKAFKKGRQKGSL